MPPSSYGHDPRTIFFPFFQRATVATGEGKGTIDLEADGRAEVIVRIVENVSWSNEVRLRALGEWGVWHETCVELHCVHDADRLDAIGAFGIMRCAAYSAITKRQVLITHPTPILSASSYVLGVLSKVRCTRRMTTRIKQNRQYNTFMTSCCAFGSR